MIEIRNDQEAHVWESAYAAAYVAGVISMVNAHAAARHEWPLDTALRENGYASAATAENIADHAVVHLRELVLVARVHKRPDLEPR